MTTATRPLETGWLPDTPVTDTVLRAYLRNQAAAQVALARSVGGRVAESADVTLTDLGVSTPYVNQAVLHRPLTDALRDEVTAFYAGRPGLLFSAWPTPDLTPYGWHLVGHPTFVVRGPGEVPASGGAAVRVATTPEDFAAAQDVTVGGYPVDADGPLFGRCDVTIRLGYLDGVPVATAASLVAYGVVNLCLAATLPAARRRGVWRSLVAARMADAPELPAVAVTSDDSRPGFEAMGFLPVSRFTLWALPG